MFTLKIKPASPGELSKFQATATPVTLGTERSFYVDDTGVIRSTKELRQAIEIDPAFR